MNRQWDKHYKDLVVVFVLVGLVAAWFAIRGVSDLTGQAEATLNAPVTSDVLTEPVVASDIILYMPLDSLETKGAQGPVYSTSSSVTDVTTNYRGSAFALNIRSGVKKNSFYFNGISQVGITKGLVPEITGNKLSISAWVKIDSSSFGASPLVIIQNSGAGNQKFSLKLEGGRNGCTLNLYLSTSSGQLITARHNSIDDLVKYNQWNHVAAVYDGRNVYFYVNGKLIDKRSRTGNLLEKVGTIPYKGDIYIGKVRNVQGQDTLKGEIDELEIYKKALSTEQIQTIYNMGLQELNNPPANLLSSFARSLAGGTTITVAKSVPKTVVLNGEMLEVTIGVTNNGDKDVAGTIMDTPSDVITVVDVDPIEPGRVLLSNLKTFKVSVPARSTITKSYRIKFENMPPQLVGKEVSLGQSVFLDTQDAKYLSNDVKVLLNRPVGLAADACNYNYECGAGETVANCFQDCAAQQSSLVSGQQDVGGVKKEPSKRELGIAPPTNRNVVGTGPSGSVSPSLITCGDGKNTCDPTESCGNCPRDCGQCTFGEPRLGDAVCGWHFDNVKNYLGVMLYRRDFIDKKYQNIQVSTPDIINQKVQEWAYGTQTSRFNPESNPYHLVKAGKYDFAVQRIARGVFDLYHSPGVHYALTSCPDGSWFAPTSPNDLLTGKAGLCADWAALQLSLIYTLGVPRERAFVLCYPVAGSRAHCLTVYKSDSGQNWFLNYGQIYSSLQSHGISKCVIDPNFREHWGTDIDDGWGMRDISCY